MGSMNRPTGWLQKSADRYPILSLPPTWLQQKVLPDRAISSLLLAHLPIIRPFPSLLAEFIRLGATQAQGIGD